MLIPLPQTTVNFTVEEAYAKAKEALTRQNGTVISEEQPRRLVVGQGSLWGISPRTAKKTVTATFEAAEDKTSISYSSKLASVWKNVTIVGCVLAAALAGLCVWMALDLSAFMATSNPGFWSWLIISGGKVLFSAGDALVNLAWGLSIFLAIIIALEAAIYVYVGRNIEAYAEYTFAHLA